MYCQDEFVCWIERENQNINFDELNDKLFNFEMISLHKIDILTKYPR